MSLRGHPGGRRYWVTKPAYVVQCSDCEFSQQSGNAKGLAAQHHDRTGHRVSVQETRSTIYTTAARYERDFR